MSEEFVCYISLNCWYFASEIRTEGKSSPGALRLFLAVGAVQLSVVVAVAVIFCLARVWRQC